AADTLEIAEKAVELIEVQYEELPALFDIDEAWQTHPPVTVHPDLPKYALGKFPPPRLVPDRPNVCNYRTLRHGDVEKGFKEADFIIENRFTTVRINHCAFETHVSIVQAEPDGGLLVLAGRQSIFLAKQYLCNAFNLTPSKVRVTAHYIGGGFGSKVTLYTEPIAAVLALKTGKPVRLAFTRDDMFRSGGSRVPFVIHIRDGVKKDGTLVAREMRMLLGMGGYSGSGPLITRNSIYGVVCEYKIPNVKIDSYAVYTNDPIVTSFRGFGTSQPLWAVEQQMDIIAEKLGMDAAEFRRKNLLKEGDVNATGEIVHSIGVGECLDKVAGFIDWGKKPKVEPGPWRRGKGLALGNKYSMAPTAAVALIKVQEDGTIEVRESADEMGQGCVTVMGQIAAEEFKVPMGKIKVVWGDTSVSPYLSRGSTSQRSTFNLGNAVRIACQDARRQLFELATGKLGVPPEDMATENGRIYAKSNPSKAINITELFTSERGLLPGECGNFVEKLGEVIGRGMWLTPAAPSDPETSQIPADIARKGGRLAGFYGYAASAAEVLVNTETGEVKIDKFAGASDVGFPLNPKMCEQQVEGAAGMGVSSALWEDVQLSKGKVLNPNLRDYKITDAVNMPASANYKTYTVAAPHKDGPYGAKGTGETQITSVAPAIGNAVYNAVGVRIKDLPITREKVLKALQEREKQH
ncbi:MAG: molybdopterin-dependent oxidoreductase, partial [Chloroflexota bacterium]|nr:molybdopterin-dependent oxidoreductase [Chloroflexota bacterium]